MKLGKSSAIGVAAAIGLLFSGCTSPVNVHNPGAVGQLNLNDTHIGHLGSFTGTSTGFKVLFIGGNANMEKARKRAESSAYQAAKTQGVDLRLLRLVNGEGSRTLYPFILVNFIEKSYTLDAYWIAESPSAESSPAAASSSPLANAGTPR